MLSGTACQMARPAQASGQLAHLSNTRMSRWSRAGVLDQVFAQLQRSQSARIGIEAVSLDSTIDVMFVGAITFAPITDELRLCYQALASGFHRVCPLLKKPDGCTRRYRLGST